MNPAFFILIFASAILSWFLLSFVFFPLGEFILKIWENTCNNINKEISKEEKGD